MRKGRIKKKTTQQNGEAVVNTRDPKTSQGNT
jgi:hypothetical protein